MPTNKVSAVLPEADKATIVTAIETIKTKLPFLLTLTAEDRKRLRKMGPSSVEFVTLGLQGAQNFRNLLRYDFDVTEYEKDVALVRHLSDIRVKLASLIESIDDTMMATGSDAMTSADDVYGALQRGQKDASVKDLYSQMKMKYSAQAKERKKTETTPK